MKIETSITSFNQNTKLSPFSNAFNLPRQITLPQVKNESTPTLKQHIDKKTIFMASIGGALLLGGLLYRRKISKFISRLFSSTNTEPVADVTARAIPLLNEPSQGLPSLLIKKPQDLYHITSLENYDSMLSDGVIKKSRFGDGVFLSNLADLKNKYAERDFKGMLNWYSGNCHNWADQGPRYDSHTVVLLKFPISNSNENLLSWRQIQLQGYDNSEISSSWKKFEDFCADDLIELHKKPLEYLYGDEIPVAKVQKCGEVDIRALSDNNLVQEFWQRIGL